MIVIMWKDSENIVLSEKTKSQKENYHVNSNTEVWGMTQGLQSEEEGNEEM